MFNHHTCTQVRLALFTIVAKSEKGHEDEERY